MADEPTKEAPAADKAAPKSEPAAEGDNLGPAGLKALQAERTRAEAAEKAAADAAAERDALKAQHQSAEEKAIEKARKEGRDEASLEANRRIAKSEARAAAGGKVVDVDDAIQLLGDLDRFIVKGEVNTQAISSAIDELVKAKPYLAAAGRPGPLRGGGAKQDSGSSFNDTLRRQMRGRS